MHATMLAPPPPDLPLAAWLFLQQMVDMLISERAKALLSSHMLRPPLTACPLSLGAERRPAPATALAMAAGAGIRGKQKTGQS